MSTRLLVSGTLCATFAFGLAGCSEVDQTAKTEKVYAGKKDTRAADGPLFGGDKKKWEAALVQRSATQNEYLRTDVSK
jgi:hypothetical protein